MRKDSHWDATVDRPGIGKLEAFARKCLYGLAASLLGRQPQGGFDITNVRKILLIKPVIRIALLVQICQYHYLQPQTTTVILIVVPVAVILIVVPVAVSLMTIVGGTTGAAIKDLMGTTGAATEDSVDSMGTHDKMISALSLNKR